MCVQVGVSFNALVREWVCRSSALSLDVAAVLSDIGLLVISPWPVLWVSFGPCEGPLVVTMGDCILLCWRSVRSVVRCHCMFLFSSRAGLPGIT